LQRQSGDLFRNDGAEFAEITKRSRNAADLLLLCRLLHKLKVAILQASNGFGISATLS
jgi:hypothetical protein